MAISGQRLGKHVHLARQQILNNATALKQWKSYIFCVVRAEMLQAMDKV
jgi:biotin operon repressor